MLSEHWKQNNAPYALYTLVNQIHIGAPLVWQTVGHFFKFICITSHIQSNTTALAGSLTTFRATRLFGLISVVLFICFFISFVVLCCIQPSPSCSMWFSFSSLPYRFTYVILLFCMTTQSTPMKVGRCHYSNTLTRSVLCLFCT